MAAWDKLCKLSLRRVDSFLSFVGVFHIVRDGVGVSPMKSSDCSSPLCRRAGSGLTTVCQLKTVNSTFELKTRMRFDCHFFVSVQWCLLGYWRSEMFKSLSSSTAPQLRLRHLTCLAMRNRRAKPIEGAGLLLDDNASESFHSSRLIFVIDAPHFVPSTEKPGEPRTSDPTRRLSEGLVVSPGRKRRQSDLPCDHLHTSLAES